MALNFIRPNSKDVLQFITRSHLENQTNCTIHGIDEYPDWFTGKPPRYDYVFYCGAITLYLFLAIAIVCDEYCVPAVERLRIKFDLSYDVAGATLMALATSSPEFFINLYATFLTQGDMGLGTIQGSSVFNTLAITACCCLYTGMDFSIDWWPITRDMLWYIFSVLLLTIFIWDGLVYWWESGVLLAFYFLNVGHLLMDRKCQNKFRNIEQPCKLICFVPRGDVQDFTELPDPNDDEESFNFFRWNEESKWEMFMWFMSYPVECLFFISIPNVRRGCCYGCSCLGLTMSILWISLLTYLCSWTITVIGYHLFIPDSVMGLVILACGTSIPEAISSVIVTKKGYGSMAVCSALGSNTIDILLCLAGPWLVKALYFSIIPALNAVSIISEGMAYSAACLLLAAILLYIAFMSTRFQLGRPVGIICLVLYVIYITVSVSIEMQIFEKNIPHCMHKTE